MLEKPLLLGEEHSISKKRVSTIDSDFASIHDKLHLPITKNLDYLVFRKSENRSYNLLLIPFCLF
jgi:hypothetical protein